MKVDIHKSDAHGNIFKLLETEHVTFRGKKFTVPKGFESDGVSTPEFLWATVSPAIDPRTLRGGVTHDFIYREQPPGWTRAEADLMFLCFIIEDGLSVPRALKAYIGLRFFGGKAWKENAAAKLAAAANESDIKR